MDLDYLFSPGKIGNVMLENRIIRSATFEKRATKEGYASDLLIEYLERLANGGIGLIITGMMSIDETATSSVCQAALYDDKFIEGQKNLVNAIHDNSDAKIAAQIAHPGRQGAHPKYPNVAPSSVMDSMTKKVPRELNIEEIRQIIKKFVDSARRAYESGYDMVQLHAAHGYLLSNFISPYTNKRTDEFGGNTEKRAKILVEIYNGIRDAIGKEFPIIIKTNLYDGIPDGLELDPDGLKIAEIIEKTGFDAIEPSAGLAETLLGSNNNIPSKKLKTTDDENYFLPMAKKIRPMVKKMPLILMGGLRNPVIANELIKDGHADFISMSRPLIREPELPNRWKIGDFSPPLCISCNQCYMTMLKGPTLCAIDEKLRKKEERKRKRENQKNKN